MKDIQTTTKRLGLRELPQILLRAIHYRASLHSKSMQGLLIDLLLEEFSSEIQKLRVLDSMEG